MKPMESSIVLPSCEHGKKMTTDLARDTHAKKKKRPYWHEVVETISHFLISM